MIGNDSDGYSDLALKASRPEISTSVPLMHITSQEHNQSQRREKSSILPELPSDKYRFTVWHELRSTQVTGDQLRAPRVREGPESKLDTFYTETDGGQPIHHDRKGKELRVYRDKQEHWEAALKVNLSYQHLNDAYQKENFVRILRRLKSAEKIILIDDKLHDMSRYSFPRCVVMNLSNNFILLPKMPKVKHLILSYNQIASLSGLSRFKNLEALELFGNGIHFAKDYRYRVFQALPSLRILDNIVKHKSDELPPPVDEDSKPPSACTLL